MNETQFHKNIQLITDHVHDVYNPLDTFELFVEQNDLILELDV